MTDELAAIVEAMAEAYFAKASEIGDAVIALDSLNPKARADVMKCFRAALAAALGPLKDAIVSRIEWEPCACDFAVSFYFEGLEQDLSKPAPTEPATRPPAAP